MTEPPVRYLYQCALRWSDLDAFGHVNNARFLTLYEEARVALMFLAAQSAGVPTLAEGVVIARHEIDYVRPVGYEVTGPELVLAQAPQVRIEMWIEEIRRSRFVVGYELFAEDAVASRARTVCVPFDLDARRPRRLTEEERGFLSRWLIQQPT